MTIKELKKILLSDKPSINILKNEKDLFELIPELKKCKGFNQNNPWHPYDVYEHILHVVDNVPNDLTLRLTALFHDIGKPKTYTEDEQGIGHFFEHWEESQKIFNEFANKYNIENKELISELIYYHDYNINKLYDIVSIFTKQEMIMLFQIKKADLQAQSEQFHYLLDDYKKSENKILKKYY